MWTRFTERARRIIFFAQEEAGRRGENYVSTEHILLGLTRENDSVAAQILAALNVSLEQVRLELERQLTGSGDDRQGNDMQLTPRAKHVIDLAYDEARQLNTNYIGTEHLLLGLIREGEGLGGRVLQRLNVELEPVREQVRRLNDQKPASQQPPVRPLVRLEPGVLGELRPQEGREVVEAAWTEEAMALLLDVFDARDGIGYENLVRGGEVALLPEGVEAKLLREGRVIQALLVRLRSGEHAGRVACIFPGNFVPIREDDAPFPPKIALKP